MKPHIFKHNSLWRCGMRINKRPINPSWGRTPCDAYKEHVIRHQDILNTSCLDVVCDEAKLVTSEKPDNWHLNRALITIAFGAGVIAGHFGMKWIGA